MLDAVLVKTDWETVNRWNSTAKFSRASLRKDKAANTWPWRATSIAAAASPPGPSSNSCCNSTGKSAPSTGLPWRCPGGGNLQVIGDEQLAKILQGLDIKPKKSTNKNGTRHLFDFERNKYKYRLSSFEGKDLMIERDVQRWRR